MVRDEDGVVKVLDFRYRTVHRGRPASAQAQPPGSPLASTQTTGTITGGASVVGTPAYMAPEQMRGDAVDGRADQFAWGVLAYELLSGRLPWGGAEDAPLVIVSNILTRDPPSLRTIVPAVPANVEATILRARRRARPSASRRWTRSSSSSTRVLVAGNRARRPGPSTTSFRPPPCAARRRRLRGRRRNLRPRPLQQLEPAAGCLWGRCSSPSRRRPLPWSSRCAALVHPSRPPTQPRPPRPRRPS